ncbi:hypothetical protein CERSUDRAFT_128533 [Gelatoporia subvermispora B]|uniref:C3H1-type domain-containing protein n=1 Tax=Ceriporiopsis subvermispora (strain B) TaxID=914234 RepID=M2PXK0_CERS8|nr:hypothetical protein CERSUDRAFT_128533 [Gelatoporia subvermispora B]
MLSASMASRRPLSVSGGLPKADLSERSSLSPAGGGPRWRANGTGQFVDSASTDWELSEELVKLQLGASTNDSDAQIRTPPQSKAAVVQVHETSPLETASEDSLDSNSSHAMDQPIAPSHSRGSSGDTSVSHVSAVSTNSQTLRATPFVSLKVGAVGESRNRPHSYSGGLSSSDLTRLQQAGSPNGSKGESWSPNGTPEKPSNAEQPTYPSLSSHQANARSQDYQQFTTRPDEFQVDYQAQQRQFNPLPQGSGNTPPTFVSGRPSNIATSIPYRQPPRAFNPQIQVPPVMPSPPSFGYPASLHPAAMPINNNQQQLYEMMLPTPPLENPAMARLQQQHGVFSRNHQHSASDPAPLRDPAAMALLNSNMQAFAASQMYGAAMPPPPPGALGMFTGQFYQPGAPQDAFASPELAAQMMARLQTPYPGQFGSPVPGQAIPVPSTPGSAGTATPNLNNGPSANNRKLGLYKTELCRSWEEKGSCRYGAKCQFAHGEEELRKVQRHPKYKTEICRTFWVSGSCPYGKRCCFIHTELPASGAPPGAEGVPPPTNPDGRARSASTNSDPNEPPSSLLARISAKRNQEGGMNSGSGSVSTTPPSNGFQINSGRPGSLRVDTSVLEANAVSKQNKSAYPTYAHNGILLPTGEEVTARSPGPVTAGPDFGRHASSRMDIVGSQVRRLASANPSVRHSFNGSDIQLDFSAATPTATNASAQYGISSPEQQKSSSRINGHVRSGSAGNWGSATGSRLTAYPLSSIPDGELKANYPWAEYSAGGSLLSSEKNWA